jgi:hypothetical protein
MRLSKRNTSCCDEASVVLAAKEIQKIAINATHAAIADCNGLQLNRSLLTSNLLELDLHEISTATLGGLNRDEYLTKTHRANPMLYRFTRSNSKL